MYTKVDPNEFELSAETVTKLQSLQPKKGKFRKKKSARIERYISVSVKGLAWLMEVTESSKDVVILLRAKLAHDLNRGGLVLDEQLKNDLSMPQRSLNRLILRLKKMKNVCEVVSDNYHPVQIRLLAATLDLLRAKEVD